MMFSLVLFVVVLFLPMLFSELRKSKNILYAYFFLVAAHQIVAVCNAFLFTTMGAEADASSFNRIGSELASAGIFSFSIGSKFYENMLGVVYWVFGVSHFLGEQLSVLAFSLSCVVLIKILKQLGLLRYQVSILLVFGGLPTMVLLGSITMRESYQILFFMLAVYFGITLHLKGGINRNFIYLILFAFVMGLFHKGLIVYMLFLLVLFMVLSIKPSAHRGRIKKLRLLALLMLPIIIMVLFVAVKLNISGLGALSALANMEVGEYASNYREHSVLSRATYGVTLDLSSPFAFISSALTLYVYYLFAPFPWQIGSVVDVYAVLESMMRLVLIYYSIKHWHNTLGMRRRLLGLMLILFFSMSFLWALGTTNYGTAMRHHMLTWWILVVVGWPSLTTAVQRLSFVITEEKHLANDSTGIKT